MVKTNRRLCMLAAVIGVVSSYGSTMAGVIRHDRADSRYTGLANTPAYQSVGRFDWTSSGGSSMASGTLISNKWVLTAAHVLDDPNAKNMQFTIGGKVYKVVQSVVHKNWDGNVGNGHDVALARLEEVVQGVEPAKLYTGNREVGMTATVVGYGKTGDGFTGSWEDAGTKRAGQNLIGGLGDVIDYSSHSLMADFDYPDPNATGKALSLDLEYLAAPGDSGGGWFVNEGGVNYLAGVTSFGYATDGDIDSSYGDIMGATRVSQFTSWIYSVTSIPEPHTAVMLLILNGGMLLARRRRQADLNRP